MFWSCRPVAGQLSSALASLAVRATCWEADALVPQLLHLLLPPLAPLLVGAGAQDVRAVLSAQQVAVDPVAVTALLQVRYGQAVDTSLTSFDHWVSDCPPWDPPQCWSCLRWPCSSVWLVIN